LLGFEELGGMGMKYRVILIYFFMSGSLSCCTVDDLMRAILVRDFAHAVRLIRARVIDLNQRWGDEGITPLMACVTAHRYDVVRLLLEYGSDPNLTDNQGRVPLSYIDYFGGKEEEVELVRLFRSHGADMNIRDVDGRTPLWILGAGFCDNSEAVVNFARLLLNYGADVGQVDSRGMSLVKHAQHSKIKDIINMAILLVQSALTNDGEMAHVLLQAEPFLVGIKYQGKNCLELARDKGNYKAARAFEDFFANVIMTATEGVDTLL